MGQTQTAARIERRLIGVNSGQYQAQSMDTIWRLKTRGESPDMPVIAAHDTGCQPWGKTDPGGSNRIHDGTATF